MSVHWNIAHNPHSAEQLLATHHQRHELPKVNPSRSVAVGHCHHFGYIVIGEDLSTFLTELLEFARVDLARPIFVDAIECIAKLSDVRLRQAINILGVGT